MVGFGFVDNVIMIVAGDAIDASLGVRFGVSTLAAAGLGNLISDVCGVGMGDLIEVGALRMGLAVPAMTAAEAGMRATAITKTSASVIGISIGCLLGMFPLLFMNNRKDVYFDDHEKELFDDHFKQVDMEQFFRLMRIAQWHKVEPGHVLINPGKLTKVVILHEGTAKASGAHDFVYVSRRSEKKQRTLLPDFSVAEKEHREAEQAEGAMCKAQFDLTIAEGKGDLAAIQAAEDKLSCAKAVAQTEREEAEQAWEAVEAMQARGRGCVIGGTALIEPAVRNLPYPNRVVATSDCFYVEFQLAELSKMMEEDSSIAAAVYHCFYKDRVKKVKSRGVMAREQALQEYKTLMRAVLADGFVHPQERAVTNNWRKEHQEISDEDHIGVLKEMNWSPDDWAQGARRDDYHIDARTLNISDTRRRGTNEGAIDDTV